MKQRLIGCVLAAALVLFQPALLMAQSYDARLEGYSNNVTLKNSMLVTWLVLVPIVGACVGVMFVKVPQPKEEE